MSPQSRRHLRKARDFGLGLFLLVLTACDGQLSGYPDGTHVLVTASIDEARGFQRECLDSGPRTVVSVSFGGVDVPETTLRQPGYYLVCYRMPEP